MVLDILSLTYLMLEDFSVIFNILLFYVVLKHWQETKKRALFYLLAFSGTGIFISGLRIFSYAFNLRIMSIGGSETLFISILGFLSSGFFLLFIDFFEDGEVTATRLAFFSGMVGFFTAGRIIFRLHSEVQEATRLIVGIQFYYSIYTFVSMVPIFFNVINFIIAFIVLRRCIAMVEEPKYETQLKMLQLSAFLLYMFSYIFITIGNFLWDLGFMNEIVSLINSIIPIISDVGGIFIMWYIFSGNALVDCCPIMESKLID